LTGDISPIPAVLAGQGEPSVATAPRNRKSLVPYIQTEPLLRQQRVVARDEMN
jgi:hypothetical protein